MASSATTGASQLPDRDLYEHFRDMGLSHADAVRHIELRRQAQEAQNNVPTAGPATSPTGAALAGAARTATSGLADEAMGLMAGLRGAPPQNAAQQWLGVLGGKNVNGTFDSQRYAQARDAYRNFEDQTLREHPGVTAGAGFLGAQLNPLNYLLGPMTQAMTLPQKLMTYGGAFGAAQGAGEGTSPANRAAQGAVGGVIGAATGLATGVAGKQAANYGKNLWKGVAPLFRRTEEAVVAKLGKDVPESVVNGLTESTVRRKLGQMGFKPEDVETAVATWRNGGVVPQSTAPPVLRPGETVEQIAPNGFAIKGPRVTPPPPTTPTVTEILEGRGQTLPYYPRGGLAEQSIAPPPSQTPIQLSPNQNAAFIEFLKGASSPQEQAARVGTLKALGVLPGPSDEAQLLQILGAR